MEEIYLTDLIDKDTLQMLQDGFSKLTGMAALTTDKDGNPVTEGSGFTDFCKNQIRKSEIGCKRCIECDKKGAFLSFRNKKISAYFCHSGLIDFAAPIVADGQIVGAFVGGQVLPKKPNENYYRKSALEIGLDPDEMVEAVRKVNVVDIETINNSAAHLGSVASAMSKLAMGQRAAINLSYELERAAQMKADFLANMSHEIRTPMNAVIGMAEMALREDIPDTAREYITQIKASGKSLLAIINDILDFSKIESGKLEIVEVEYEVMSIINDIVNVIESRIGDKDIELIVNADPNLPHILYGDDVRIKQMITNLANNAVKFTNSGAVTLEMTFEEIDSENIWLDVSIRDTGIGIKEEDIGKLFQSFQQVDSKRNRNIEGTGLGLAITQQLAYLMNGGVDVQSVYGKGSLFHFRIPQKVIDRREEAVVKNKEKIFAVGMFRNEYMQNSWQFCLALYGIHYEIADNYARLLELKEEGANYFFLEYACIGSRLRAFAEREQDVTCVAVIDPFVKISDKENFIWMKKPLYCLNLAAVFNGENMLNLHNNNGSDEMRFTAREANVLIVDDNGINLTVAEGLLKPLEMHIDTASSGKMAITMVQEKDYDLIFMDHMMPEMDGVETTHSIRELGGKYLDIPILALTANALSGVKEMFIQEGMNDFVPKPIEIRTIASKIKQWLPQEKVHMLTQEEMKEQDTDKMPEIVLEGIDIKQGMSFAGTVELYKKVLRDYYVVIEKKANLIAEYERNDEIEAYTIEVHALKSASRLIGAEKLATLAERLEEAGNEGNIELIHEKTEKMLLMYRNYQNILKDYAPTKEKEKGKEKISKQIVISLCDQLAEAADMLDLDTMEMLVKELKKYQFDDREKDYLLQVEEAVQNIDSDSLIEVLDKWKKLW